MHDVIFKSFQAPQSHYSQVAFCSRILVLCNLLAFKWAKHIRPLRRAEQLNSSSMSTTSIGSSWLHKSTVKATMPMRNLSTASVRVQEQVLICDRHPKSPTHSCISIDHVRHGTASESPPRLLTSRRRSGQSSPGQGADHPTQSNSSI